MKLNLLFILLVIGLSVSAQQTTKTASELKKEIGKIMHETNWSDKAQSDSANAKIAVLSKEMMMIGARQQAQQSGDPRAKDEENLKDGVDYQMKLWHQMWESAVQGEGADINLAKPLREEIVEAYKDDEFPKVRPEYYEAMTVLVIDMSVPTIQRVIDQMENYKGINTLVITGGDYGAPVNLEDLLRRARNYPLKTLDIINFRQFLTEIPASVNHFDSLTSLAIFNNHMNSMPDISGISPHLDSLLIDLNPVPTLQPYIQTMQRLKKLGIAQTSISEAEIREIEQMIPQCQILR